MSNNSRIFLSIVIPAYNEEPNLYNTLKDIAEYLKAKDYSYEVIIVDDGSKDNTRQVALSAKPLFNNIGNYIAPHPIPLPFGERVKGEGLSFNSFVLLENERNYGKGYSVKKGVLSARGDVILFMDADNSTRIDQLDNLLAAVNNGYDIAIASRRVPGAQINKFQPLHRIILGNIYILSSKVILGTKVKDYNCGFKLFTKDSARLLFSRLTRNDWSFDSELIFLISKYKLKITEVPVRWKDNRKTSKVKPLRDGINSLVSLFKIRLQAMRNVYN